MKWDQVGQVRQGISTPLIKGTCILSCECLVDFVLQIVCGQNCTFVIQANGSVLACGEGSYGRLGQGNSDDLRTLTLISTLQGNLSHDIRFPTIWYVQPAKPQISLHI